MYLLSDLKRKLIYHWRQNEKQVRFRTSDWRRLPDFLIIGTQKGGTTSLFYYLCQHPRIRKPFRKEVHYFDRYYVHGIDWYKGFFPFERSNDHTLTGEASPEYLYFPAAPARAAEALPDNKLVVMLRDPVDRAYSHFKFYLRRGIETEPSFERALELEAERIAGEKERVLSDWRYKGQPLLDYSYFDRGLYAEQIARWFEHFPREQFLFIKSENFFSNPQASIDRVCDFLGLPAFQPRNMPVKNAGSYRSLDEPLLSNLRARYQDSVDELVDLLGPTFKWW